MSNSAQFDLEQQIMDCWHVTADLDMLFEAVMEHPDFDKDKISNVVLGLKELYELKFDKMFRTFEQHLTEFYDSSQKLEQVKFHDAVSFQHLFEQKVREHNEDLSERDSAWHSVEWAMDLLAAVRENGTCSRELAEDIDTFLKEHNDA